MKKTGSGILFLILVCVLMLGCGKQEETVDIKPEPAEQKQESKSETEKEKAEKQEERQEEPQQKSQNEEGAEGLTAPETFWLYLPNENVDGFLTEEVKADRITPEILAEQLKEHGILSAEVQILSLEQIEEEGEAALNLDLNDAFGAQLGTMGTAGEYALLGCVCNTFLEAYHCQKIRITVEGEILSTGHAEYPGYMRKFEY